MRKNPAKSKQDGRFGERREGHSFQQLLLMYEIVLYTNFLRGVPGRVKL